MAEADCPDEVCVHGLDRRSCPPIACVPHGLTVTVAREGEAMAMASMPWRASIAAPSTLRVCRCALMAALACALAAFESAHPRPDAVPGMKLGIANVVTVAAAFWLGPVDAAVVLGVRIVLAAFLTGQLATLPFSIVGGACALAVTLAFVRFSSSNRVRLAAMAAAVAHNIRQIAVAVAVTGTPGDRVLPPPVLLVAGIAAGFATSTVAQAVLDRIPHAHTTADRGKRVRA